MKCFICGKLPQGFSEVFQEYLCLDCLYDALEPEPDGEDAISSSET